MEISARRNSLDLFSGHEQCYVKFMRLKGSSNELNLNSNSKSRLSVLEYERKERNFELFKQYNSTFYELFEFYTALFSLCPQSHKEIEKVSKK